VVEKLIADPRMYLLGFAYSLLVSCVLVLTSSAHKQLLSWHLFKNQWCCRAVSNAVLLCPTNFGSPTQLDLLHLVCCSL
jgi:hypothetical protein